MMVDDFTFGQEMSVSRSLGGDEGGAGFTEGGYSTGTQQLSNTVLCTPCSFLFFRMYTAGTKDLLSASEQG